MRQRQLIENKKTNIFKAHTTFLEIFGLKQNASVSNFSISVN